MPRTKEENLTYAFGHLTSSIAFPDDAHAGDSADLAYDVLGEIGLDDNEISIVTTLAEHVAANYDYTGAQELAN